MIEILEKGFFTLPVTSRRHALASLGVPAGGPMDAVRYLLANRLVGNPDDAFALEATLILPGIRFADRRAFAVVGGVKSVILRRNGEKHLLPAGQTVFAAAGDELLALLELGDHLVEAELAGLHVGDDGLQSLQGLLEGGFLVLFFRHRGSFPMDGAPRV